jgi:SAM-dependent methyltransferase
MRTLEKRRLRKRKIEAKPSTNGHAAKVAGPVKINLGCGRFAMTGYDNRDRGLGHEAYPLPDADNSADEIRASHILEHFPCGQIQSVLADWVRVLKPGGMLKIAVPNFDWIARKYLEGAEENIQGYIMGGQSDGNDYHHVIFDKLCLKEEMKRAGLVDIQNWKSSIPDCASYDVSLNLAGRKPLAIPEKWPECTCAMSTPRLGFNDNFFGWAGALMPLGIVPRRYEGCYWSQCLERVMTTLVDQYEYILTLDYDSFISLENIQALRRLMYEHPEADAIAAMQMSRGRTTSKPLLVIREADGTPRTRLDLSEFEQPLLKVETAHFGCTVIRTEKLKQLPHPWFKGEPAPDGNWGEGRIDDDIYFWHRWRDAGLSAYVANRVVIGHAELMVTWPDKDLNPIHQYPSDYHELGLPENVWE